MTAIFRFSPTFYSFIAGILVSLATNLFTGLLTLEKSPPLMREITLHVSIVAFLVAALACLLVSLRLEIVREEAKGGSSMPFIRKSRRYLWMSFSAAAVLTFVGFVGLALFR